jgi:hypothetical protein
VQCHRSCHVDGKNIQYETYVHRGKTYWLRSPHMLFFAWEQTGKAG